MMIYPGRKMWWAWCGGGHEYKTQVPNKKIGPFLTRPEPLSHGETRVSNHQGSGVHTFTLYGTEGQPLFVNHELSWHPTQGHKQHIKRAHIAYEVFGDPLSEAALPASFVWRNDCWEPCIYPLLSDAVPQA